MAELKTNLLEDADFFEIEEQGVPDALRGDLVKIGADGAYVLTLKGHQYYGKSCARWGLDFDLASISSSKTLWELENRILGAVRQQINIRLEQHYLNRQVPVRMRETIGEYLYGTRESWNNATTRRAVYEAAGPNVVGLSFNRKRPQ